MSTSCSATTNTVGYSGYGYICWHTTSLINLAQSSLLSTATITSGGQYIHLTNATINTTATRPMETAYRSPRDTTQVSPLILGLGTCSISGSVSFDMSKSNVSYFLDSSKIARNTYFELAVSDGIKKYAVFHCVWDNITISASVGGLVTCTISYIALNCRDPQIKAGVAPTNPSLYFDNTLVAYWESGASNHMQSFNLSFSQQVTPVYLNNDFVMPTYLRCGSIGINATIDSWFGWEDIDTLTIGDKKVKFNNKTINVKEFSHSGAGDVGKHSYQMTSVAVTKPTETIFTIT